MNEKNIQSADIRRKVNVKLGICSNGMIWFYIRAVRKTKSGLEKHEQLDVEIIKFIFFLLLAVKWTLFPEKFYAQ